MFNRAHTLCAVSIEPESCVALRRLLEPAGVHIHRTCVIGCFWLFLHALQPKQQQQSHNNKHIPGVVDSSVSRTTSCHICVYDAGNQKTMYLATYTSLSWNNLAKRKRFTLRILYLFCFVPIGQFGRSFSYVQCNGIELYRLYTYLT